jgi:colanic acid/amylovoran biosynthesis protein
MTTVSIVGVTGFRNRGVEALVQPIVSSLLNFDPNVIVNIYSWTPDFDQRRLGDPRVHFRRVGNFYPTFTRIQRVTQRLGFPCRGQIEGWQALLSSALVIFTGGDCLSAEYGDTSFSQHLMPLRLAAAAGIPFVLHAQSIGPFGTHNQRRWWNAISSEAAHISVRESTTYSYLKDELGFPRDRLSMTADPAFILETDAGAETFGAIMKTGGRTLVGVALSQGIAAWSGIDAMTRLSTWETLLSRMLVDLNCHIALIPHVQETHTDDAVICHEIWRRLRFDPNVSVLAGDFSASEYKGVLSQCDAVVAERMHAGIAALSNCVPTAMVAYSVKARGILDEMVGARHAAGKALIEGADFHSPNIVWSQIKRLWDDRHAIAEALKESVPRAKALALDGMARLHGFVS